MQTLWAPWRMQYILGPKQDACPFCLPAHGSAQVHCPNNPEKQAQDDQQRAILKRGKYAFVLLNKFPYNNGHIMVTPYRHIMDITELSQPESYEISDLIRLCALALKEYCAPEGINIGLNMGAAAGAGIAAHLHYHLVPRWNGDSSFMAVLDEVRIIPEHIQKTYNDLFEIFKNLEAQGG